VLLLHAEVTRRRGLADRVAELSVEVEEGELALARDGLDERLHQHGSMREPIACSAQDFDVVTAHAEGVVRVRTHRRLDHELCGRERFEGGSDLPGNEVLGNPRRHDGDALRTEIEEVALVEVPAHDLEWVEEFRLRIDPREGVQELVRMLLIVPGRSDHHGIVARPVDALLPPGNRLHRDAERGERLVRQRVVHEEAFETRSCEVRHFLHAEPFCASSLRSGKNSSTGTPNPCALRSAST
jgi:hypothetical protein